MYPSFLRMFSSCLSGSLIGFTKEFESLLFLVIFMLNDVCLKEDVLLSLLYVESYITIPYSEIGASFQQLLFWSFIVWGLLFFVISNLAVFNY